MSFHQLMEGKKIKFPEDIISAITGSIAIIPDGMASAVMAKLNPVNGVYSAVIGLMVGSWTTNSVFMSVTTVSALALATGSALRTIPEDKKIAAVLTLTLMVGIIQIIMGFLKLGFLVRFVSNAVMRGFLTGVAVMIIISQVADFTGNYNKKFEHKVLNSFDLLANLNQWNYYTIGVALVTMVLILLIEKTKLEDYAICIALLLVSTLTYFIDLPVQLVGDENKIPLTLPRFSLPDFTLVLDLLPSAVAIALIGFIQSVGVSHMIPNPSGDYPKDSKDILGQGVTNIASGFATGFPVGGSLAQTALMIKGGAKSRWANFLTGLFAGLIILLVSHYLELLPMACLATILILTGVSSIKLSEIKLVWNTSLQSRLVMLFTFIATMAVSFQVAVFISIIVTFILHVIRASNKVLVRALFLNDTNFREGDIPNQLKPRDIIAIQPYGSLFFAGAKVLREKLPDTTNADKSVVIIHMEGRNEIGSSFIKVILNYSNELSGKNSKLILADVTENVYKQLEQTDLLNSIGKEDIYKETLDMGKSLHNAWNDAKNWIDEQGQNRLQ